MLQHLPELFAAIVGRLDDCPDAVNTAWIRLVTPREDDTNRSRWDTDPMWRVVQSTSFADVPVVARRMIRRKQRSHDVAQLVRAAYRYLVSFTAAQFREGEQWDVSRALQELATALVTESEKPKKDFGELVRERRKICGLPVMPREAVLPSPPRLHARMVTSTVWHPGARAEQLDGDGATGAASELQVRAELAEGRMQLAYAALEDAERQGLAPALIEQLEAEYRGELATASMAHTAAQTVDAGPLPPDAVTP